MLEENDRPLTLDDYEDPTSNLPLAQSNAVMALATATSELARAISKISYTPTQWVDNSEPDINAANLNKIEQGILQATTAIKGAVDAINAINGNISNRFATGETVFNTVNDFPMNGSSFGSVRNPLTLYEGFTIPKYSKCIFINYTNSNDGALIAIEGGKTYTAFRNNGIWQDGKILITNTDLNETVRNLAIDGRLGLDFNSTTKILSLYLGSNRIGTINVN